ncbi:CHAD domain-containing protein [Marinobacter sp. DUT-1]|uniref:CHAD domain-containing protein n=1 Tax=Marinobacter sp. DUT-1 TaxID=3412037 RepID=UPI003D1627CA
MKHLFLVRHAKSSWADETLSDHQRPLNSRGESQLGPLGRALVRSGAFGGTIHASDAVRAQQTLAGVLPEGFPGNRVHTTPDLYTFDYRRLLHWLNTLDDGEETVAIIGHNPALLELAEHLLKHPPANLPTAGFVHIQFPDKPWHKVAAGKGRLEAFLTPREFSYRQFARKQKKRARTTGDEPGRDIPEALSHQLQRLGELQPGVKVGLDDEFLHQFRIAIRRSRAIAESVEEVTGDKSLKQSIKQLKHHARATSRLRDLHVFLQDLPVLCDQNNELQTALGTWAETEADQEHHALVKRLESKRYRDTMHRWDSLIHSRQFRKLAGRLTPKDIRKAVENRIKEFNRRTAELLHNSPDEDIHRLRKLLKRIRYLMELDAKGWKRPLKALKQRQELYGRFQDLHVQIELVKAFRTRAPETLPGAVDGLKERLEQQKADARRQILALGGLDGAPV